MEADKTALAFLVSDYADKSHDDWFTVLGMVLGCYYMALVTTEHESAQRHHA
ncbi:MAG TPA: hypothetical protein H9898_09955 [Candidatus Anaerobiospirillum stercoravium]|nr:hypothetical protein [Candidatus Anaerobiospirillum stercoravium]